MGELAIGEPLQPIPRPPGPKGVFFDILRRRGIVPARSMPDDPVRRHEGRDWPRFADTMIGRKRLDNVEECARTVIRDGVPGDFIEAGVWRGGASILMRAVLAVEDENRRLFCADSFEGLPPPDPRYRADAGFGFHKFSELAVSVDEVRANFERYGLLDESVVFVKGWFRDTLPGLQDKRWALIRLDGDMYESTMDGLVNLYPRLSPGGFVLIDDYGDIPACKQAVEDYRTDHSISEPIKTVDWSGAFWRKG